MKAISRAALAAALVARVSTPAAAGTPDPVRRLRRALERAAHNWNPVAIDVLAWMYEEGAGQRRRAGHAGHWRRRAAEVPRHTRRYGPAPTTLLPAAFGHLALALDPIDPRSEIAPGPDGEVTRKIRALDDRALRAAMRARPAAARRARRRAEALRRRHFPGRPETYADAFEAQGDRVLRRGRYAPAAALLHEAYRIRRDVSAAAEAALAPLRERVVLAYLAQGRTARAGLVQAEAPRPAPEPFAFDPPGAPGSGPPGRRPQAPDPLTRVILRDLRAASDPGGGPRGLPPLRPRRDGRPDRSGLPRVLARARDERVPPPGRALRLTQVWRSPGRDEDRMPPLEEAVRIARGAGNPFLLAVALEARGHGHRRGGRVDAALRDYLEMGQVVADGRPVLEIWRRAERDVDDAIAGRRRENRARRAREIAGRVRGVVSAPVHAALTTFLVLAGYPLDPC